MRFAVQKPPFLSVIILLSVLAMVSSCSVIKNYPANTPFVYDNKLELTGDMSKDEKNRLTNELINYWDDSLKSRRVQTFFGFKDKLTSPPVFDTANITRSVSFMNAYLNSQGYYYASFHDSVRIDTVKDQLRTSISMYIDAAKNISIDSVSFDLKDTTLQRITLQEQGNSLLKKGNPYSKQVIDAELDRLVGLYRQNGYYYFTREDIHALVDSIDASLLTLTLDPFKQAQIIAEAAKNRRNNPAWDITILRKPVADSNKLRQYHIGKVYFYPETKLSDIPDSLLNQTDFLEVKRRELVMRYKKGTFTYQPLRDHSYFRTGDLYNESSYFKTMNTLGQLGAWQQVDGRARSRDKDSLDIFYFLIPSIRQSYQLGLESSLNTTDIGVGNVVGISGNIEYTNRNVWKQAIQSITTFRTGVELNILSANDDPVMQTFLVNLGHTYSFPKLILPFKSTRRKLAVIDNKRTLFSINGSYVDRYNYYQLRSLVTSWGYEWKKGNNVWLYKPINIELYSIDKLPLLDTLIKKNPFLNTAFNEGRIISQQFSLTKNFKSKNNLNTDHLIKLGAEEAGGLFGLIPGLTNNIYRYIKLTGEYRKVIKYHKTDLAWRAFAGFGYNYGTDSVIGQTLPFFKQFSAGGPYSMRAWGLRQLGLGSSDFSERDTAANSYRDRFGDMQLEVNVEYRFPIATIAGINLSSALFADMGNIWNVKNKDIDPNAQFSFQHLMRDLAIGVGTGLRIDVSYFLIRLDFAYKVKDPLRPTHHGWMNSFQLQETRANGLRVNNYAVQLGIGMPF